jgi:hypothetical protein
MIKMTDIMMAHLRLSDIETSPRLGSAGVGMPFLAARERSPSISAPVLDDRLRARRFSPSIHEGDPSSHSVEFKELLQEVFASRSGRLLSAPAVAQEVSHSGRV